MSVVDEVWTLHPRALGGHRLYSDGVDEEWATVWDTDDERARLAAQAPAMARLLLEIHDAGLRFAMMEDVATTLRAAGVL